MSFFRTLTTTPLKTDQVYQANDWTEVTVRRVGTGAPIAIGTDQTLSIALGNGVLVPDVPWTFHLAPGETLYIFAEFAESLTIHAVPAPYLTALTHLGRPAPAGVASLGGKC